MPKTKTIARELFEEWWRAQTSKGDPTQRPNLVEDAYLAGFADALRRFRVHVEELGIILNGREP